MSEKWRRYKNFEGWVSSNHRALKHEHEQCIDKNYTWVQPDTYVSFDDFCMGKWQSLD